MRSDLLYFQYWNKVCLRHEIEGIKIYHDPKILTITYASTQLTPYLEEIIYIDILNTVYGEMSINDKKLIYNLEMLIDDAVMIKLIRSQFNQNKNVAVLKFDSEDKDLENVKNEFLWFTKLVRVVTKETEEDDYFIAKEIDRRERYENCFSEKDARERFFL